MRRRRPRSLLCLCAPEDRVALGEARREYQLVEVDFRTKTKVEGDDHLVTPKAFVPALKLDDGEVITEGAVVLQWIADHAPGHALIPPPVTKERYRALEWLAHRPAGG